MVTEKVNRVADRVLQVRITEDLKARLDAVITAKGYNKSAVLRKMLEDWLQKEESSIYTEAERNIIAQVPDMQKIIDKGKRKIK